MAGKANFGIVKGDTFVRNCGFNNKTTGLPVDLTGCTIAGKVNALDLACSITDAVNGKFRFGLSAAQTTGLAKINTIEVQVTYPDSTVTTLLMGNLVTQELS